jgi:hypothetical protein
MVAAAQTPLALPDAPVKATVETAAAGIATRRRKPPFRTDTKMLPAASHARPSRPEKTAAVPTPGASVPLAPPATSETLAAVALYASSAAVAVPVSPSRSVAPQSASAFAPGWKTAFVPTPSADAVELVRPASVVTTPASTRRSSAPCVPTIGLPSKT